MFLVPSMQGSVQTQVQRRPLDPCPRRPELSTASCRSVPCRCSQSKKRSASPRRSAFAHQQVLTTVELATQDEQVKARKMMPRVDQPFAGPMFMCGSPLTMSGFPCGMQDCAPLPGQHNRGALRDVLGRSSEEPDSLYTRTSSTAELQWIDSRHSWHPRRVASIATTVTGPGDFGMNGAKEVTS